MDGVLKFFGEVDHRPSQAMVSALTEVATVLEAMADDSCAPDIHLSSLDPGVGKTQTIVHFIQALMASDCHGEVGVLLCVSRLEEISTLVATMGLATQQFGVLTSDHSLNGLGIRPQDARVLFTTHSMVENRTEGRRFSEVSELFWNGRQRQVRIWDEAILPGQTLTLSRDDIGSLFKPLRSSYPALTADLEQLFSDLGDADDGKAINLPDFALGHGVDINTVVGLMQGASEGQLKAAQCLWLLSGKTVTIRKDGRYGQTLLDYRDTLPEDLAPLLVLDASGRVRTVYRHWEERRGGLVSLTPVPKRYDNLTVRVWQTGGGKSAFRQKGTELVDGIASTINSKPDEEWLVVYHQKGIGMDLPDQVRCLLTRDPDRVHFLGWGSHDATNRFAHVSNVILAGTLFYPASHYEALGRLGAGYPSADGPLIQDDFDDVMLGEHRHLILQALCRGAVRRCVGNHCAPCDAYIIASVRSGIPEAIPSIFPGCRIVRWQPVRRALKGKVGEAVSFIVDWFKGSSNGVLSFAKVARALGMDTSNFRRNVRQHQGFIDALAEEGVFEYPGRPYGFSRHPFGFIDESG